MRTIVYVDAFNLYYGCLKGTPYRWLDLPALCRRLLPHNQIQRIKYFTALVSSRPSDPGQPQRQQTYLRALRTFPDVEIIFGHYLTHRVLMPLVNPPAKGSRMVKVLKTEEKGSDVNLATHMVHDAHTCAIDAAVVVSNDSDLVLPVRVVREQVEKMVGVLNPHPARRRSRQLQQYAGFFRQIRRSAVGACQLPETLSDAQGDFHKPIGW